MVEVDLRVSCHLKEELTYAMDKRLQLISTIMLFKNSKSSKELRIKPFEIQKILYTLLCGP